MHLNKLIILLLLGAASAHVQKFKYADKQLNGLCPKIKFITNFSMPRIVGWWYRAFSSVNNPLCLNNDGQTTYTAQYDDKALHTQVCCRSATTPDIAICGRDIGTATVTATSNPGEFVYEFYNNTYPFFVLDTDYDNYTIVYGCKPGPNGRDEIIFVFSRRYQLNNTLVTRARNVIQQNGIDWSKAKPVKQGPSIPYTPGLRPCGDGSR